MLDLVVSLEDVAAELEFLLAVSHASGIHTSLSPPQPGRLLPDV